MSDSVRPDRWHPPGSSVPGILRNTGVGCHFPLQCMKVKSESEVAQLCPTLHDPMDCSLPGTSTHVHGIFQARVLEWVAIAFSPTLISIDNDWKTIALAIQTFVGKVISLLFNMLSTFVIAFLPRSKCLLISWF